MALKTPPYIRPMTGTSTVLLNWMRRISSTNTNPAAKQITSANSMRTATLAAGTRASDNRMPSLAASRPPEVAGSTNLLRTRCCRITPHTDRPTPVSTSAARRGRRLAVKVSQASPDHSSCRAPTSNEVTQSRANMANPPVRIRLARRYASPWPPGAAPGNGHNALGWPAMPPALPARQPGLGRAPRSGRP